jgi:hypothetical protein
MTKFTNFLERFISTLPTKIDGYQQLCYFSIWFFVTFCGMSEIESEPLNHDGGCPAPTVADAGHAHLPGLQGVHQVVHNASPASAQRMTKAEQGTIRIINICA